MPPRIPVVTHLNVSTLCFRPSPKPFLPITSTLHASTKPKRQYRDQYAIAQSKRIRESNISRQTELNEARKIAAGDPVRGVTTPFLESFDDVGGSTAFRATTAGESAAEGKLLLDHFLTPEEFQASVKHSFMLTSPESALDRSFVDPVTEAEDIKRHAEEHANALEAIARITSLATASQKGKTRANVRRCIETFGRHQTDLTYRPRPPVNMALLEGKPALLEKTPRAGPDTGSSEVQIAILTAKIRVLANQLEQRGGQKDKINKRNLRVMVHKRQKLLRYLRTKERGSDRWQKLVDTLGLSEATWKGEISL